MGKGGIICLFLVSSPQGGLDYVHMGWARHAWRILAWKVPVKQWGKREVIVNLRWLKHRHNRSSHLIHDPECIAVGT
jgi:hypothetical protein